MNTKSTKQKIIRISDKIYIFHQVTNEMKEVEFDGIHAEKPYILWRMCGTYCVDMNSGLLKRKPKSKNTTMWKVSQNDMLRLEEAIKIEKERLREQFRKNKKA